MNFCTKCASYYQTPGTCNCYAATQPYRVQPWYPTYPYPYTPTYTQPWTSGTVTITNTPNDGGTPTWYNITTSGYSAPVT